MIALVWNWTTKRQLAKDPYSRSTDTLVDCLLLLSKELFYGDFSKPSEKRHKKIFRPGIK